MSVNPVIPSNHLPNTVKAVVKKMSTFGRVIRLTFWSCLELNFLLLYLVFVFFPYMTFITAKRIHIKNKVKRKMIRNGMPRDKAKIFAKRYQSYLASIGSIKGIYRISRKTSKAAKAAGEETNNKPELENLNNAGSLSIV